MVTQLVSRGSDFNFRQKGSRNDILSHCALHDGFNDGSLPTTVTGSILGDTLLLRTLADQPVLAD